MHDDAVELEKLRAFDHDSCVCTSLSRASYVKFALGLSRSKGDQGVQS